MQRVRACAKDTLLIWGCAGLLVLALGSDLAACPPEDPPQTIDPPARCATSAATTRTSTPAPSAAPAFPPEISPWAAATRPTLVGDDFRVVSQWHDAESRPVTPHPPRSAAGGGGQTALHPTWSLKAASAAATQEAIGGSFVAKESDPWQAHMQLAASGNGAAPA